MATISSLLRDHVTLQVRSVDRLFLHAYVPKLMTQHQLVRFWLDRGVAGFRLDAVPTLFEDTSLKDEEVLPGTNKFGDPKQSTILQENLPEVHIPLRAIPLLQRSREVGIQLLSRATPGAHKPNG